VPTNDPTAAKTTTTKIWLARLVDGYVWLILALSAAAMTIITVVMTVQVVFRYGLNSSLIWAEEICRYLLIAMTFLPIGLAYQRGEVVGVDFFLNRLPPRIANLVRIPVQLGVIVFLLVISYYGYRFATFNGSFAMPAVDFILTSITGRQVSGAMTMYWVYLVIPAGCLILAVHFAVALARSIRLAIAGQDTP
jgi:TRAP-type C4-dicarboxylate transport system permease small subunit